MSAVRCALAWYAVLTRLLPVAGPCVPWNAGGLQEAEELPWAPGMTQHPLKSKTYPSAVTHIAHYCSTSSHMLAAAQRVVMCVCCQP